MKQPPNLNAVPESERRVMTPAETELMLTLMLGEPPEPVPADQLEAELGKQFKPLFLEDMAVQIMLQRLKLTDKLYDPRTVAMAAFLSDRPGFAVLWAYTLYERTRELGRPYAFCDLVADFPMGFPTNEGAAKIWDAQKGWSQEPKQKIDNLLDQEALWKEPAEAQA